MYSHIPESLLPNTTATGIITIHNSSITPPKTIANTLALDHVFVLCTGTGTAFWLVEISGKTCPRLLFFSCCPAVGNGGCFLYSSSIGLSSCELILLTVLENFTQIIFLFDSNISDVFFLISFKVFTLIIENKINSVLLGTFRHFLKYRPLNFTKFPQTYLNNKLPLRNV